MCRETIDRVRVSLCTVAPRVGAWIETSQLTFGSSIQYVAPRVGDLRPMGEGKDALVFDNGSWVPFSGVLGQIFDAKPLTDEEAISMTS